MCSRTSLPELFAADYNNINQNCCRKFTSYNMGEVSLSTNKNWDERFQSEKERMKGSLLHAYVVVNTSNLMISHGGYAEERKILAKICASCAACYLGSFNQ